MSKKAPKEKTSEPIHNYKVKDVVLAKIRGYPPWPAQIVDPTDTPKQVAKERPNNKKNTFYCVRFFPAGDYSWAIAKDLSLLQKHEIEAYISEPHKKSGDLLKGYQIALNPEAWEAEREAQRVDDEEAEADAEIDELEGEQDGEADEDGEKKPKAKKKREPEAKSKPKKKKDANENADKKKKESNKRKKGGDNVESEDGGDDDASKNPSAKRQKRDKDDDDKGEDKMLKDPEALKVKDWRHKLQRSFLGKVVARPEDMPQFDQLFTTVENYENLSVKYLQFSKIGKVMRHIAALDASKVPRDDEFKIRSRAQQLVEKWHKMVDPSKAPGSLEASGVNGASAGDLTMEVEEKPTSVANGAAPSEGQEKQDVDMSHE
ncbi:hypothetical protein SISNIDRAFT_148144 [Sistotremastrum niveocremeum HHB9708]|uniref:PWWP domain-containing protein n=1 Tax=Sistotremastrum niveocremeum HHB9708 TaxID=1314777 RepID=A0A165A6X2_9AGAM|nr:hypothetical protein SISNIDRAFT_148144 [Sistotremastrum niveocremeum HHB9708]